MVENTSFVLDCSVLAAWCHEDEATQETEALLATVPHSNIFAPQILHFEIANVLLQSSKRGRIPVENLTATLSFVDRLRINYEAFGALLDCQGAIESAKVNRLSFYDATYLELARRKSLPLATLDKALITAAQAENISVLP